MLLSFKGEFLWGVSASGFQFEMGDSAGKGVDVNSDWFVWVHDAENIKRGIVSGDLPENGVDYWNMYAEDHKNAKKLGLNAYRIGVEWSRVFPKSTSAVEVGVERASDGNISKVDVDSKALEMLDKLADKDALNHYKEIIADLRKRDFKVFVCLNHFTLPLWIHNPLTVRTTKLKRGPKGWLDEAAIIEFTKYAAYLAWSLGGMVDSWAVFNEPMAVCEAGYMIPESGFPPGVSSFRDVIKAAENMAVAYARAYDAIKKLDTVKADSDSQSPAYVGLIHNVIPAQPLNNGERLHVEAAKFMENLHNQFFPRAVADGWLDENLNGIREKSEAKNYLGQRLDWLGVNYYTRFVIRGKRNLLARLFAGTPAVPEIMPNYGFGCQPKSTSADGNPTSDLGWEIYPKGLLDALKSMAKFGRPLYVTENGVADEEDKLRPKFIENHVAVLEKALNEEKIDVRGYFHWALTDNYEWAKGFKMKFGLFAVDLQTKKRIMRKSAKTYKQIIEEWKI
ncbi:glycoside hydrolase family 1 protein [Candidatus Bathyarchaeota archaeon A05DMB-3]|jgi:beta-galactosidase|nr:glycoside hydrolase family 1 protein [Candidatus Bathyarchaeota archaeon A05DMB-3]